METIKTNVKMKQIFQNVQKKYPRLAYWTIEEFTDEMLRKGILELFGKL
jgi:hypothetical protein